MKEPLVSIITIVYNGENVIEKTIQSVLLQSYKKVEYIIIDGGSSDNTVAIIKKYEQRIGYWISEKDTGISNAFNKGIKHAKGEIIGLINASDWYEPNTIQKIVSNIGAFDIAYGNLRYWKHDLFLYIQKANHNLLKREMRVNHPTVFVKKSCYTKWGYFDEQLKCAMDFDMLLRLQINGCSFIYIDSVLANMQLNGLSDKNWYLGCKETLAIKNKYLPEHKLTNTFYFAKHVIAIWLSKALGKTFFSPIIKYYRTFFSRVKKEYTFTNHDPY